MLSCFWRRQAPFFRPRRDVDFARHFRRRALCYEHWDHCLASKTRFFGAASVTNRVLGHLVSLSVVRPRIEACAPWLSMLGVLLEGTNSALARAVTRGDLAGANLDYQIVSIEQSHVEERLRFARSMPCYP